MIAKLKNNFKALDFRSAYKKSRFMPGTWIEWSLAALVLFVSFFIFLYVDYTNTIDNSVLFTKALFSGNFFDFYQYTIDNASTSYAANYEMLAYIPFAIWNLPLAIANMAFGFDYNHSTPALLWSKAIIVVMAALCIYFFYKILRYSKVEKEKSVLGCYSLVTSILLFWPAFIIVQVDIASVLLMLIGFYQYLKGNQKLFILFFALAIPFKMFALFLFIPLLLLKEKRIPRIILKAILVLIPELLCKVIYRNNAAYEYALKSQSDDGMDSLFNYTQVLGSYRISLFVLVFVALCIFCYLYKLDSKSGEVQNAVSIYTATLLWGLVMIFVAIRGYWLVYIAPFMMLSIFTTKRFIKVNLLLELISGISFIVWNVSGSGLVAKESKFVWRLLLYKFVDQPSSATQKFDGLHGFVTYYGIDKFKYVCFTIFVCSIAAIVILTCPFLFKKIKESTLIERSVILIRPIAIICLIALYIFAYTATTNPVATDFIDKETNVSTQSDLIVGNTASQQVNFKNDCKLDRIKVVFDNSNYYRNNFCSVDVQINDLTTNETVFSKRVGCSLIESKEPTIISLNKTYVDSNHDYEITFKGNDGIDSSVIGYKNTLALYRTEKLEDSKHPAYINGVTQNFNLAFSIR